MLVSYNWLQDYLTIKTDPYQLANEITLTGIEIADVKHPMEHLKKIVVGHVLEVTKHPDSDHLKITKVDVGETEPLQIVCGAPNVATDQYVIVALVGAHIAGNHKIKKGRMRGVDSYGMICSLQEIGFDENVVPKDFVDGIYFFDQPQKPGTSVFALLGMDDYVIDFDITPNRADTLSMEGSAYEVGAILNETPKIPSIQVAETLPDWTNDFKATVNHELAPKYLLRQVHGVKIVPSPLWMQRRLWNAGIRPLNNVVDITNYVMLTTGQPLHAFDANTVQSKQIVVRTAKAGEKLQLLNENEIELDKNDIVVTDGQKPIALAGVMGGLNSEITSTTENVIIESAVFDGAKIRKTAQRHGMRSEASARFEKGLNWDNTQKALDLAASLMAEYAEGEVYSGTVIGNNEQKPELAIQITPKKINHVLGTDISQEEILAIFSRLGFTTDVNQETITVTIPNRRWDIFIDADLIEEVARLYGYRKLPMTLPTTSQTVGGYSQKQLFLNRVRALMLSFGLTETINYSLTSAENAKLFTKNKNDLVQVVWPMNSDRTSMRQSLLAGLIEAAAYNVARKQKDFRLFEQGRVFDRFNGTFDEYEHVAGLYAGLDMQTNWQHEGEKIDFYFVKGQVEMLLSALGLNQQVSYRPEIINGMHPTRTAAIYIGDQYVGFVGELGPVVTKFVRRQNMYAFELNLEQLLQVQKPVVQSRPAPKYPAMQRDLSVLIDEQVSNQAVTAIIQVNGGKYLQKIVVFDVFAGEKLGPHKKSIAYQLTFLNPNETLTDDEINQAMRHIQEHLESDLSAVIR